jgi:hypothetical protein
VRGRLVGASGGFLLVAVDDAGAQERIPLERIVKARQELSI